MLKAKELKDKSVDELEAILQDLRGELFKLVNEYRVNKKLEQPHLLKHTRRDKARVLTVLEQKRQKTNG